MTPPLLADIRFQQLRKLTQVSRALTYAVSLEEVLKLTAERAAELLEADRSVLLLTNADGFLSIRASHGLDPALCEQFREPLEETLSARLDGLLGNPASEYFLGVPLVVSGAVTGMLAVARPRGSKSLEEEEWLLAALADQAAVALEKTRLDETAEFRERLIGIVSHDLRNPISAILLGTSALMRGEGLNERVTRGLERIQSSAERAHRMIHDLLDYTQAHLGGGIRLARTPVDLHVVVRQVADELEITHPKRRIDVLQEGSARGDWDADRLAQVAGNLMANALRYSPEETAVRVESREERDGVTLSVHNEGTPIPAERLPTLFQPMQRLAAEMDKTSRSVGLGLYIVKHLVEVHGGTIEVTSTRATGTTFTVRLPQEQG